MHFRFSTPRVFQREKEKLLEREVLLRVNALILIPFSSFQILKHVLVSYLPPPHPTTQKLHNPMAPMRKGATPHISTYQLGYVVDQSFLEEKNKCRV